MSLIRLQNISKSYGSGAVLREVFFKLDEQDRVGLIGRNGAGKTTLLRLILGQETPDGGTVEVDGDVTIGYFSQFSTLDGDETVMQVAHAVFAHIHELEEALLEVEISLEDNPSDGELNDLLEQQADLIEQMNLLNGWTIDNRIDTVLTKLGFSEIYRQRPINQLSGGWRNRAALAKILLEQPDVLLLDEPTNFLDIEGLDWLESWLRNFPGALLIISHDRHFIDGVVNRVVEVENYHLQLYDGGFNYYVREKQRRVKSLQRQFVHEEELLLYEAEAIEDRREALKDPSNALKRKLANIKKQAPPRPVDKVITDVYEKLYVKQDLCQATGLSKAYGEQVLFENLSFSVHRGDRIAIIGANGSGKTSLLRVMVEDESADEGQIAWTKNTHFAYYNQILAELDLNDTVTHAVNVVDLAFLAPRKKINRFLSMMQFSEIDLTQRIGSLSGGQQARVALAKSLLSGASVLILDEPTNHLDVISTQVMERALAHFPGAVIVVSHDRFFIDKIATRLLLFEGNGQVQLFNGNWTIWQGLAAGDQRKVRG